MEHLISDQRHLLQTLKPFFGEKPLTGIQQRIYLELFADGGISAKISMRKDYGLARHNYGTAIVVQPNVQVRINFASTRARSQVRPETPLPDCPNACS
jgi:hypothetical protein